jgi:hypothetical protein
VGAGVIVPPDMMNSILDSLQKQFLIDGKKWIDASAVTQHGDMSITRVSDRLK